MSPRQVLEELFRAGLRSVHAGRAVERSLAGVDRGGAGWAVLAVGKAAVAMAAGARAVLGEGIRGGSLVTREGSASPVEGFLVREAAHPIPDARGVEAADAALELARGLERDDRLLLLLSGGGSALLVAPVPGVTLEHKRELTGQLLRAGVDITGINTVRKHVSRVKGGWLADAASPASVLTLAVSDVADDAPETIGSGPSAPDPTRFADALAVLEQAGLRERAPASVVRHLVAGAEGAQRETPKPGAACFERSEYRVVASLDQALRAAREAAEARGLRARSLGRALAGEARECASRLAEEALRAHAAGLDLLIVGGEPTVTVRGDGRGGRAQELALAFALALEREGSGCAALFAGTDGSDGPTEAAGAVVDGGTLARGRARKLDPADCLERNDSHRFLDAAGDLLVTGPTDTNVTDLGLILLAMG